MKLLIAFPVLLLFVYVFLDQNTETLGINLFMSPQQAEAFVADVKTKGTEDPKDVSATSEEIGISVKPGEVEKEIQEEFVEDNSDPQEAALETEERAREKTEL